MQWLKNLLNFRYYGRLVSKVLKVLVWTNSNNKKSTWDQRYIAYKKLNSPGCQSFLGCCVVVPVVALLLVFFA